MTLAYEFEVAPDGGDVALDFLLEQFPAAQPWGTLLAKNVGTRTPSSGFTGRLPFVMADHFGGDDERMNLYPTVDLHFFGETFAKARDFARASEARLIGYPFRVSSGGRSVLVDRVEVLSPAVEVEWQQDSTIRRFQGTYQFSIRRR